MGRFDLYPDLAARCQDLTLRCIPADELGELGDLLLAGLFAPGEESTLGAWYDPDDLAASARRAMAYHLRAGADTAPGRWDLPLGVYLDDHGHERLIGVQSLHAENYAATSTVASSSFLAQEYRGRGYGIVARQACLAIAFTVASAKWATTAALASNEASIGVSLACGYLNNGVTTTAAGTPGRLVRQFLLPRKIWEASTRPPVTLEGFAAWAHAAGLGAVEESAERAIPAEHATPAEYAVPAEHPGPDAAGGPGGNAGPAGQVTVDGHGTSAAPTVYGYLDFPGH